MISIRFATAALLLSAVACPAVAQVCPIPPAPTDCLQLEVGEVQSQVLHPGQVLCVEPGAATQEYTVVPVNYVPTSDAQPTFLANDVIPVTGPPAPMPAKSGALALGLPGEPFIASDVDSIDIAATAARDDELAQLLAGKRREQALIQRGRGSKLLPTSPPAVGDLLDIQVAPGCSGPLDMRKARIETVSPAVAGQPRLYFAQEVVDDGAGGWMPAVPGGFTNTDFDSIRKAYEEPVTTPPTSYPLTGSTNPSSIATTDARAVVTTNFGEPTDVDGNGGIVVFFTRWMNELSPPASSVVTLSHFDARDLFSSAPASCPRSNEGEIVYMAVPDPTGVVNSNVRTYSFILGETIRSMAHEMTRLTHAGRRIYVTAAPGLEERWLDQALAWMSSELLFYRNSVGLAPRGNIVVTNLTTGPYASRRVAAFNGFANRIFGSLRQYYLFASGGQYPGRYSVLTTTPASADSGVFPGVTAAFLRYALDRANGDDAATLRAMIDSPLTGQAKLESIFGADMRDWARDFGVAMYADDNAFTVDPIYRTPSWHYRSIFIALNTTYPLTTAPLTDGVSYTPAGLDQNGGLRWLRFGVDIGTPGVAPPATFQYTLPAAAPMTPLRVAVVRTK